MFDINTIVDKLLDMKPDPIPTFALLKEFKKISPDSNEYSAPHCQDRFFVFFS